MRTHANRPILFTLLLLGLTLPLSGQAQPTPVGSQGWLTHLTDDLMPFWTTKDALGTPVGNFPTYRDMKGRTTPDPTRYPRMLGRQTFAYGAAYLMTGKAEYLEYARAGVRWTIDHAWDKTNGGWYARLRKNGDPVTSGSAEATDRTAQDAAYDVLGLAMYFFITRDPEAESSLLKTEALMFDPKYYWDEKNQRIRDALDQSMTSEKDQAGGGWELVALLDQLNAYMVLVQPVLSRQADRDRWAAHMVLLGQQIRALYWKNDLFWGQYDYVGRAGGRHVDFGHHFKSLWMLLLTDLRLGTNAFSPFALETARRQLPLAINPATGLWNKSTLDWKTFETGSDWWTYAEDDQLAATLDVLDDSGVSPFGPLLAKTGPGWLQYYRAADGEVIPGIQANGSPAWRWGERDTAKANEWKNGFHSTEHALVMYLHDAALETGSVSLYFAVPKDNPTAFMALPYVLPGVETARESGAEILVGGQTSVTTKISFRLGR